MHWLDVTFAEEMHAREDEESEVKEVALEAVRLAGWFEVEYYIYCLGFFFDYVLPILLFPREVLFAIQGFSWINVP